MHKFEWDIGHKFATHGTQVEFDASHIRNNETGSFGTFCNDSRRSQVHFVVLLIKCISLLF